MGPSRNRLLSAALAVFAFAAPLHMAIAAVELKADHPERYTVVKGDTLWGIAGRFLNDPWLWPKIWKRNEQIQNPHLIYPGDVIILTLEGGEPSLKVLRRERPTVKLSPSVRVQPIEQAIPTIPPEVILPFLSRPLVLDQPALKNAGYVAIGVGDSIVLGQLSRFYARGLENPPAESYDVFRPGATFVHPDTGEVLGHEAIYLGSARLIAPGDPATLEITRSELEVNPGDRLVPSPREVPLPYYFPEAPARPVRGYILAALRGVSEVGSASIVSISLGAREGMKEGHVLKISRNAGSRRDPVTGEQFTLPLEDSGVLMVFRTFEKVSYGLILRSTQSVNVGDTVNTP